MHRAITWNSWSLLANSRIDRAPLRWSLLDTGVGPSSWRSPPWLGLANPEPCEGLACMDCCHGVTSVSAFTSNFNLLCGPSMPFDSCSRQFHLWQLKLSDVSNCLEQLSEGAQQTSEPINWKHIVHAWNISCGYVVFRTPRNHLVDLWHFLWKVKTWKPRKLQFNEIFSWRFLMQVLISLKSVFETSVQQLIREAEPRLVANHLPWEWSKLPHLAGGRSQQNMTKLCENESIKLDLHIFATRFTF